MTTLLLTARQDIDGRVFLVDKDGNDLRNVVLAPRSAIEWTAQSLSTAEALIQKWASEVDVSAAVVELPPLLAQRDALVAALHTSNELHREVYKIVYQSELDKGDRLQRIAARVEHLVPQVPMKRTHHG